jgi:magnesium-transporting ATPase (P-type)
MEATEATISVLIIGFTFLVIMYVEMFMYRKSLTKKEVADYQEVLNEMDTKAEANYGLKCKHDATTELMRQRKEKKSFTLIFSGIFLAFVFILLACMTTFLTLINIGIISISGIILICYGLIKIAESKGLAIVVLSIIFIIGTVVMLAFNELMASSPYAYWYFCLLVLVIGVFSLIAQNKKLRN